MKPELIGSQVRAHCPSCDGAITTFESSYKDRSLASFDQHVEHEVGPERFNRIVFLLLRCAGCGRAGLAEVYCNDSVSTGLLASFVPRAIDNAPVPDAVPHGVLAEYREAKLCASAEAWRGASGLLRSTLEKTLRANGYEKGSLADRINEAAADGVITAARAKRAHEDIRVLGNDVLHDEWRKVTEDEVEGAHRYAQRILEDLYDDRQSVEAILKTKGRIK